MLVGRLLAGMPAIDCPAMTTVPSVGSSNPAIRRSSVVLPQPDGPSREKNSPSRMVASTPLSAVTEPKALLTPSISMMAFCVIYISPPVADASWP